MFAYCLNSPVTRIDSAGKLSYRSGVDEFDPLTLPWENAGGGSGGSNGSFWSSFTRTLQGAADGLNMAMGQRDMSHVEQHHLLSDKSKIYTPQYKEIADRYNYSLDHQSNIVSLPGHKGRHTNAYHEFMISSLRKLDAIASGNPSVFIEGMNVLGQFIMDNDWLPYAKYK